MMVRVRADSSPPAGSKGRLDARISSLADMAAAYKKGCTGLNTGTKRYLDASSA